MRHIREAGVHRGGTFQGMKKDTYVQKKKDTQGVEQVVAKWDYWEFAFIFPKGEMQHRYFCPEEDATKITVFRDLYVEGVTTRKMTAEEQIKSDLEATFYFLTQLAVAQGYAFLQVREMLDRAVRGGGFNKMMEDFAKYCPPKSDLLDMKVLWCNNKNKKVSFLTLPNPTSRNGVFGKHIPEQETVFIGKNEEKAGSYYSIIRTFKPPAKAEEGGHDASTVAAAAESGGYQPIVSDQKDLF
jgi:hypothetical protein